MKFYLDSGLLLLYFTKSYLKFYRIFFKLYTKYHEPFEQCFKIKGLKIYGIDFLLLFLLSYLFVCIP